MQSVFIIDWYGSMCNAGSPWEERLGTQVTDRWVVEQTSPVGPQVYRALRDRIIRAELEPGSLVSEAEIARSFAISRQPVREAFIKLAEDGLVEVRPQRGTLVRKINIGQVMDARFVREAVEADIVKVVASRVDASLVANLRQQVAAQRDMMVNAPENFMPMDETFHRTLAEAADKAHVWSLVNAVKAQMDRVRHLTLMDRSVIGRAVEDHALVVEAIARGDAGAADQAMRKHLQMILLDLPAVAQQKPEYFESIDLLSNAA